MSSAKLTTFALAAAASAAALATTASAFAFLPSSTSAPPSVRSSAPSLVQGRSRLFMSDEDYDYPSDSSSEEHYTTTVDAESETYEPTEAEATVNTVLDELLPSDPSVEVTAETRASINEALLKLEGLNPTTDPAYSPLLNGVWTLRYAGGYVNDWALPSPTRQLALFLYSGGYSPGLFALSLAQKLPSALVELGDLEISISREQPRIEAKIGVKLLGGTENEVVVRARLDTDSAVRLTETYESATVLGNSVDLPQAVQYSRDLYVTYVDEDILVVRDASGVPEILVRK